MCELQKLCGFLNHLCCCIVPGRAFTRHLYAFTSGTLLPHHHININQEMRSDLSTWLTFLESSTVYCRPFADYSKTITAKVLLWYTDAFKNKKLGFGGLFNTRYYWTSWTDSDKLWNKGTQFIVDMDPSIEYLELYAVTVSVLLRIHKVKNTRIYVCLQTKKVSKT